MVLNVDGCSFHLESSGSAISGGVRERDGDLEGGGEREGGREGWREGGRERGREGERASSLPHYIYL